MIIISTKNLISGRGNILVFILTTFILLGCGSGSSSPSASANATTPDFVLSIESIKLQPGIPATISVVSGVRPFNVTSENSAVLPVPSTIEGTTLTLQALVVNATTTVKVVVTDGKGRSKTITAQIETPGPLTVVPAELRM